MNTKQFDPPPYFQANRSKLRSSSQPTSLSKRRSTMIIQTLPETVKCPVCGSENVQSKLSFTTIVAWVGKILGVPTVKIFEKRCALCGRQFRYSGSSSQISLRSAWTRWGRRGDQLRGWWCELKLPDPVPSTFHLHLILGN